MNEVQARTELKRYLSEGREALVWKLEGLSEYDRRRPLVPTATNLLGLVKHLIGVETGYLGLSFSRPFSGWLPRLSTPEDPNGDMFATADETSDEIVACYRAVWAHSDETIDQLPLDTVVEVPWWPPERHQATLHHLVVRVIADTHAHAGHADILREMIDGSVGWRRDQDNLPSTEPNWWVEYRRRVEDNARSFEDR